MVRVSRVARCAGFGESTKMPNAAMRQSIGYPAQPERVRVARHRYDDNSRIFIAAFLRFFQRVCRLHMELFDADVGLVVVAGAVAVANLEPGMRDPAFRRAFSSIDTEIGIERQRGCNALSIAESTGLPRETVRRKINRLIEKGILMRRGAGDYVLQPGVLQSAPFAALFRDLTDETIRLVNECLDEEILAAAGRF
jgi:hypothetical protein